MNWILLALSACLHYVVFVKVDGKLILLSIFKLTQADEKKIEEHKYNHSAKHYQMMRSVDKSGILKSGSPTAPLL